MLLLWKIIKSIIVNKDAGIFNQEFKRIFVIETLKKVFDNLNYDSQKGISEETIWVIIITNGNG